MYTAVTFSPILFVLIAARIIYLKGDNFFVFFWRWEQSQQHLLDYQGLVTLCLHVLSIFREIEQLGYVLDQERSLMTYWVQWIRFPLGHSILNNDIEAKPREYQLDEAISSLGCWRCIYSRGCYCIGPEVQCKDASFNCSCSHHWQWVDSKEGCSWVDELATGYNWDVGSLPLNDVDLIWTSIFEEIRILHWLWPSNHLYDTCTYMRSWY